MKDIFIGIDGGASSCRARVEDADGNLLGLGTSGPANIQLSVEKSWRSILEAINIALNAANLSLENKNLKFHLGLGLAGCEVVDACNEFMATAPKYFSEVCLRPDSYAACIGAHAGKDGAIIIIGTGSVGLQIQNGESIQVGGWGLPHSDEGSGAWLGIEGVRLTFQWLDCRLQVPTADAKLLELIFQHFDNNLTKLVTWATAANSSEFAKLAPLVIKQAEQADPIAIDLMQRAAAEIDKIDMALERQIKGKVHLPCALFGGIAPFIKPLLGERLKTKLVPVRYDAAIGAILMINKNRKI
jgi:glucosamine kinase